LNDPKASSFTTFLEAWFTDVDGSDGGVIIVGRIVPIEAEVAFSKLLIAQNTFHN
jgi:hypothetical protein